MYYLYRSHIGDGYITADILPDKELVCSQCGKKDKLIGEACNIEQLTKLINKSELQYSNLISEELSLIICETDLHIYNDSGIIKLNYKDRE